MTFGGFSSLQLTILQSSSQCFFIQYLHIYLAWRKGLSPISPAKTRTLIGSKIHFILSPLKSAARCLPSRRQDELAELQMDRTLKFQHSELSLDTVWLCVGQEYPSLAESAINVLIQIPTSYLCELASSSLTYIKNQRGKGCQLNRTSVLHCPQSLLESTNCSQRQPHVPQ